MERDGYLPEGVDAQPRKSNSSRRSTKDCSRSSRRWASRTVQSYCGAQIFEAIGLNRELDRPLFHRDAVAHRRASASGRSAKKRCAGIAWPIEPAPIRQLDFGGEIHYRIQGEHHNWNPETIYKLQHATRANDPKTFAGVLHSS